MHACLINNAEESLEQSFSKIPGNFARLDKVVRLFTTDPMTVRCIIGSIKYETLRNMHHCFLANIVWLPAVSICECLLDHNVSTL
jgi:hypothetical protein